MSFSREFLLALACSQWPRTATRTAAVREASRDPIDWQRFLRLVRRHRIAGMAHDALNDAGVPIDPETRDHIASDAMAIGAANLGLLAETTRLERLFGTANVPTMFLKGVPLAIAVFNDLAVRHAKDIDLLVAIDDVSQAAEVLERSGYRRVAPPPSIQGSRLAAWRREFQHFSHRHSHTGVEVELHWRPFRNRHLARLPTPNQSARVRLPGGTEIRTLDRSDLLAYLCTHGAMHGWFRLKWLADIHALVEQESEEEIERLFECACARGALLAAGQALLLSNRLLRTRVPSGLLTRLRADRRIQTLERQALTMMAQEYFEEEYDRWPLHARLRLAGELLRLGDWRMRAAGVRMRFVDEHAVCALPARAALAYPMLRVFLWLRRQLGPTAPRAA